MIYVVGGMKYGVGKTTTAVNLAVYLSERKNRDVLLIDSDPSECASEFMRWRYKNNENLKMTSIQLHGASITHDVSKLENKFDDIVIDSGVGENLSNALNIADRLIVPFNSKDLGLWTVWTLTNLETAVDRALENNSKLKAYSFFISKPEEKDSNKEVINTLKNSQHIEFIEGSPLHKDTYAKAMNKGYSIYDIKFPEKSSSVEMTKIFEGVNL